MARGQFQGRSARRKPAWAGSDPTADMQNVTTANTIIQNGMFIAGAAGFVEEEVTLVRTRGHLMVITGTSAGTDTSVAVGLIKARQVTIAAGAASLPSPLNNPESDWIYHVHLIGDSQGTGAVAFGTGAVLFGVDSKAMRIIEAQHSLVWLAEVNSGSPCRIQFGGRYLVKLT